MPGSAPPFGYGSIQRRNLIATIGTSTIGRGEVVAATTQRTWGGVGNVANMLSQGRFYIPQAYSRAISGETTNEMRNRQLAEVLRLKVRPRGCLVQSASGDVNNAIPAATTQANLRFIVNRLLANGIQPIICVPQPVLDFTLNQQRQMAQLARFMREMAWNTPGCLLVDVPSALYDGTLTTYEMLTAYADTVAPRVHLNHPGTVVYARQIVQTLADAGWQPVYSGALRSNGDLYDATHNPRGNLMANGMMTGTGGTVNSPATGPLASGWTITPNSVGGTIALSQPAGGGVSIAVSGSATAGTGIILSRDLSGAELATIQSGEMIEMIVEAEISAMVNMRYAGAMLRITDTAGTWDDLDGAPVSNGSPLTTQTSVIFRPVPRTCASAPTVVRPRLFLYPEATGAWSGTVTFKTCAIRKVIPW